MSFLKGILGNSADKYVDQAVDTAAKAAKVKVKTMLDSKKDPSRGSSGKEKVKPTVGGDDSKQKESSKDISGGIGGIGGLMDGNKGKEEGGFGSFLSGKDEKESSSGGGDQDLNDLLGDIAGEISGEKDGK